MSAPRLGRPATGPTPARVAAPRISVIVPVYNAAHLVGGLLDSLDRQTLSPGDYEVVVVDDGSTDRTLEVVRAFAARARARIRIIERPENRGPAAARNAGLARAVAPVVAFTDADCEVAPDWLERALGRLDAAPGIAGVEGRTVPKGSVGTFTHQMENHRGQLYMTCNMVYRREALETLGGFDERFRAAFLEDSDVAFGVLEAGGEIRFAPDVLVEHLVIVEGARKFWRDARKRFYNALLYRKHPAAYRRFLRPVVPAFPAPYVDYLLALTVLGATALSGAWWAAAVAGVAALHVFRRVAHGLRARDPLALAQAAVVPLVQTIWAVAGAIRFRSFSARM